MFQLSTGLLRPLRVRWVIMTSERVSKGMQEQSNLPEGPDDTSGRWSRGPLPAKGHRISRVMKSR